MTTTFEERAAGRLRSLVGPEASFRPGQLEAIRALVADRSRALVVQRTGWGKSAVYFIATSMLREEGAGPTVIISPLLALMRNQVDMARRLGLEAHTINSSNREEHETVLGLIDGGAVDLLLISPERLQNPQFREEVLPGLVRRMGLLVIDEVHCISDWGHDFRPDYRRLRNLVQLLPPGVPVLGTTATANDRVVADVQEQLGADLTTIRGSLERESLALQVLDLPKRADRLAWLAGTIPRLPGSGIVYCLTIRDAHQVAAWLASCGIDAVAYTGDSDVTDRLEIEERLLAGEVKVVAATSALGMGYDNPNVEFVVHYQCPGSPIAYYQQVGRAGRAVDRSFGVLLAGEEDSDIQDYFIRTAFPAEADVDGVLDTLGSADGMKRTELERYVNLGRGKIEQLLKILEVEGAVYREGSLWFRSGRRWQYPRERIERVLESRRAEQEAMRRYVTTASCLMEALRRQLDDPHASPCGRCASCRGRPVLPIDLDPDLVARAQRDVRRAWIPIPPRRRWPPGIDGPTLTAFGPEVGWALCAWGDTGWGVEVEQGKYRHHRFDDSLVEAVMEMLRAWRPDPAPLWVAYVPAFEGGGVVADVAHRLGARIGLPVLDVVRKTRRTEPQKAMNNSFQQAANVRGAFAVTGPVSGPGLLVDDMVDSRWTLTEVACLLREAGADRVYPVALADTSRADT